jgi:hypothetical protein
MMIAPLVALSMANLSTVSVELQAAPLGRLFPAISAQVKETWTVSPQIADLVMTVYVKDVSVEELRKRVADAAYGQWTKEGEQYRLIPDTARLEQLERDRYAYRVNRLKESQQATRQEIAKRTPYSEAYVKSLVMQIANTKPRQTSKYSWTWDNNTYARMEQLKRSSPQGRVLDDILVSLNAEEIARIPDGERVVFSSHPTKMQLPLRLDVGAILKSFNREAGIWNRHLDLLTPRRPDEPNFAYELTQGVKKTPATMVVVSILSQSVDYYLEMRLADRDGMIVGTYRGSFRRPNRPQIARAAPKQSPEDIALSKQTINLPPLTVLAIKEFQNYNRSAPVPSELSQFLSDPVKNEPLSLVDSPVLIELAKASKRNLVAVLSDHAGSFSGTLKDNKVQFGNILTSVNYMASNEDKDRWYVISNRPIEFNMMLGQPRDSLRRLLQKTLQAGYTTFETRAEYLASIPWTDHGYLGSRLTRMLTGRPGNDSSDVNLARFYHTLTPAQKQLVIENQPIPFRAMNAGQIEMLTYIVFRQQSTLHMEYRPVRGPSNEYVETILREPTNLLPNGIPLDGALHLKVATQQLIKPGKAKTADNEFMEWGPMEPQTVAYYLYMRERPDLSRQEGMNFESVQLVSQTSYNFRFQFAKDAIMTGNVQDQRPLSKPGPVSTLPKAIQDEIQKRLAELRVSMKDTKAGTPAPARSNRGSSIPPSP